jgi:hypothetical protein
VPGPWGQKWAGEVHSTRSGPLGSDETKHFRRDVGSQPRIRPRGLGDIAECQSASKACTNGKY